MFTHRLLNYYITVYYADQMNVKAYSEMSLMYPDSLEYLH